MASENSSHTTPPTTSSEVSASTEMTEPKEPWPFRYQLLFRSNDQLAVAILLVVSLLGAIFFFAQKAYVESGIVDIDRADQKTAVYLVDINAADWPEIANLPGIGPKLAGAVVEFRQVNGRYMNHDQLLEVSGIGPSKLKNLRQFLAPIDSVGPE